MCLGAAAAATAAREMQDNPQEDSSNSISSSRKGVRQIMRFHSMVSWLQSKLTTCGYALVCPLWQQGHVHTLAITCEVISQKCETCVLLNTLEWHIMITDYQH